MSRRYQTGRPVTLNHVFIDDETGEAITLASVAVTVYREGSPDPVGQFPGAKSGNGWSCAVGMLAQGAYTATWDAGDVAQDVTSFEVVGGFIFQIPEVWNSDVDLTQAKYPADSVRRAREAVETEFQRITGRSFTTRTGTFGISIGGVRLSDRTIHFFDGVVRDLDPTSDSIILPLRDIQSVVSVTELDGTPVEGTFYVEDPNGILAGFSSLAPGSYKVTLQYGFSATPADIKRVALMRVRNFLVEDRSGIPDRATSYQPADGGTYTIAMPGRAGFETGDPEVDEVLSGYAFRIINDIFGGV